MLEHGQMSQYRTRFMGECHNVEYISLVNVYNVEDVSLVNVTM